MSKTLILLSALLSCSIAAKLGTADNGPRHAKVLILGAGASGIKAAETLQSKGMTDFMVLEGKDYIGGRIQEKSFADGMAPLGAQWLRTGSENPVWGLVERLQMAVTFDNFSDYIVRNGNNGEELTRAPKVFEELLRAMKKISTKMSSRGWFDERDVPLGSALGMNGWAPLPSIYKAMEYYSFDFARGESPKVLSTKMLTAFRKKYLDKGKDAVVTDKTKGMGYTLKYLANPFLDRVKLNTIVKEINQNESWVSVITKGGDLYTAEHVIVTFSSGVLTNNLIKFTPSLPGWKKDAFHLAPMCSYCKIFLKFPTRFWDDTNHIILAQKNRGDHVQWHNCERMSIFGKEYVLMLTLTENLCLESEQMNDNEVKMKAVEALRRVYGSSIPMPTALIRSRWTQDPMTMGAYSNPVVGFEQDDYERLQAPVGRIWFAGEYTTEEHGNVPGAFKSGEKTAKNIFTCMKTSQCQKYKIKKGPKCIKVVS